MNLVLPSQTRSYLSQPGCHTRDRRAPFSRPIAGADGKIVTSRLPAGAQRARTTTDEDSIRRPVRGGAVEGVQLTDRPRMTRCCSAQLDARDYRRDSDCCMRVTPLLVPYANQLADSRGQVNEGSRRCRCDRMATARTPVAPCKPVDGRLVAAQRRNSPTIVEFLLINHKAELRRHPSALVEAERARVTRRVDPEPDAVLAALPEARE